MRISELARSLGQMKTSKLLMNCSCQFGDKGYQYKSLPDSVFDAVGGQIDYASESDDCMDNDEQIRSPNSEHDGVDKNQELSLEYNQ